MGSANSSCKHQHKKPPKDCLQVLGQGCFLNPGAPALFLGWLGLEIPASKAVFLDHFL